MYVSYHPRRLKGPAQVWSAGIASTEGKWAPQKQCPDMQHLLEEQFLSPAAFIGYGQQLCAEEKGSCYHPVALVTFSLILVLSQAISWHQPLTGFFREVQFSWLFWTKYTVSMVDEFLNEITNQKHLSYHLPSAKSQSTWWWNKKEQFSQLLPLYYIDSTRHLSVSHAQNALFHSILDDDKSKIILHGDYLLHNDIF